ncbi:MAG: ABC transporter substrate-binding protein [Candidatus Bathyarchaeia archaeon]|jgi:iron complex transport system substrate-binding protein
MVGRTVTVSNYVTKIVGVNYGCLRLLTYMEASSLVCGVEQTEATSNGRPYAMAHPEYANLTKIGPQFGGDPELIAAQQPDVVFVTDYSKTSADSLQSQLGIPVISITYGGLDTAESRQTLYDSFTLIGKVLHKEARATSLINYINGLVSDLNTRTSSIADANKPTVYIGGLSSRGAHGFTSTCASYAPFTLTNSKNVITLEMAKNSTSVVNVDFEALPSLNPQIIFVDYAGMTLIKSDVQAHLDIFNQLTAVTTGKTYGVLNYNSYTTNIDIALADAYYVGSVLYPSQFSDINPAQKADEIYTFMCGAPVYSQMSSLYGPFAPVSITS